MLKEWTAWYGEAVENRKSFKWLILESKMSSRPTVYKFDFCLLGSIKDYEKLSFISRADKILGIFFQLKMVKWMGQNANNLES